MRGLKIWWYFSCLLLALGFAKPALAAAPVANPDTIYALKNEVVEFNVLANDVGENMEVISYFSPQYGEVTIAPDGVLIYRPEADFVGAVSFSYRIYDENYLFQPSEASITLIFEEADNPNVNPDDVGSPDQAGGASSGGQIVNIGSILSAAEAALGSHSRAVSQFIKLRAAESITGSQLAYWQVPRGGSAGDELLPLGGIFLSLNQQTLNAKQGREIEADIVGGTLGADFNINSEWLVGAALGYSNGEQGLAYAQANQALDLREQSVLAFSSYRLGRWLGELQLGYSSATFDNAVTALDVDSDAQFALLKAEYALSGSAWQVMPGLSVKYRRNDIDGFSKVTQGPTHYYDDHSQTHLNGVLSLYSSYAFTFDWGVLMPQLTLASEYCIDSKQSGQGLNIDGEWALLMPAAEDKHLVTADLGLGLMFTHGLSGFVNYYQVSRYDAYKQSGWSVGGRWEF